MELLVMALSLAPSALAPSQMALRPAAPTRLNGMPSMMVNLRPRRTPASMVTTGADATATTGTVSVWLVPPPPPPPHQGVPHAALVYSRAARTEKCARHAHHTDADPLTPRLSQQAKSIHQTMADILWQV